MKTRFILGNISLSEIVHKSRLDARQSYWSVIFVVEATKTRHPFEGGSKRSTRSTAALRSKPSGGSKFKEALWGQA
jgi:hypothetical protein